MKMSPLLFLTPQPLISLSTHSAQNDRLCQWTCCITSMEPAMPNAFLMLMGPVAKSFLCPSRSPAGEKKEKRRKSRCDLPSSVMDDNECDVDKPFLMLW